MKQFAVSTITVTDRLDQLREALERLGVEGADLSLFSMHLAEIQEESERYASYLDKILHAEGLDEDRLLELLVNIQLSLEHLMSHARDAQEELNKAAAALNSDEM
ncbi:MAG TPA: hypothetical protein EYP55_08390 [Anaerolineae bacterium]|nr:hypothetical protein [Anaerolineae bacterium]